MSVHDVVSMVLLLLETPEAVGQAFDCGTGTPTRIDQFAKTIRELHGKKDLEPAFRSEKPGDIKDSYADISRAKQVLGYEPKVSLQDG